ncbi:hypothetical protein [Bradyrhizobium sp. ARR65]|uniref:hypothetical protein n=1 Tax=Bradyrhizobium sp. ARR65 TaxID=1040989 RepID=UPI0004647B5D|nr:hypothetical protein [Bradyrhizobium sp. ARR65]
MHHLLKIAAAAAGLLLAIAVPAGAAEVTADDTARFLAGMQPSADSPLVSLTNDPVWQRHAKFFDGAFAQLEQRQLSKIRNWADANLAAPRPTMFYMFSGPDFLYANAFYAKANTYVFAALEPPGAVADLTRLPRGSVDAALANVEHSLASILSFSFFITKQMKVDLDANEISGTLPILYVFLARSGKTIDSVTPVSLDDKGTLLSGSDAGKGITHGVKVTFAGSDGLEKTLYYFSTDLSNSGVRRSGFLKFCDTLAPGNSLLKSASYLLHAGNFSTVRNWLLANSATIIQDDSGIPLAYYSTKAWRFFPFGRYAGPIDKFPSRYQQQYAELFTRAQPIDFGIGYRWRAYESNLLLSVKVASKEPEQAETASSGEPAPAPAPKPVHARKPRPPAPLGQSTTGYFFWPWR